MSETIKYLWIARHKSRNEIDEYLNALVDAGIDCYAEGESVFVHPDQWEEACGALYELCGRIV